MLKGKNKVNRQTNEKSKAIDERINDINIERL
jgi:hypothetical protein